MQVDVRSEIIEYLGRCRVCTIATVDTHGQPDASTVFFKNSGTSIYFNTASDSQKVRNINTNPRVAVATQEHGPPPETDRDIKGVQCTGMAKILSEPEAGVPEAVVARHRAFNSGVPGKSVIVEVIPERIWFIDYSRGFRHRDLLQL